MPNAIKDCRYPKRSQWFTAENGLTHTFRCVFRILSRTLAELTLRLFREIKFGRVT